MKNEEVECLVQVVEFLLFNHMCFWTLIPSLLRFENCVTDLFLNKVDQGFHPLKVCKMR